MYDKRISIKYKWYTYIIQKEKRSGNKIDKQLINQFQMFYTSTFIRAFHRPKDGQSNIENSLDVYRTC